MLIATTGAPEAAPAQALTGERLGQVQAIVRRLPVGDSVVAAILKLVRGARPDSPAFPEIKTQVAWGPGPRAAQAFMLAARARALMDGRFAPSIDDVVALAPAILRHRMALTFAARADGVTIESVIARMTGLLA
jgi:MoxR-like ATPase